MCDIFFDRFNISDSLPRYMQSILYVNKIEKHISSSQQFSAVCILPLLGETDAHDNPDNGKRQMCTWLLQEGKW